MAQRSFPSPPSTLTRSRIPSYCAEPVVETKPARPAALALGALGMQVEL